ncbi:hypothetical protein ACU8V3_00840 [Cobetia marina]
MADFPVKWFSSDMGGSPENGDQYGALIELLKACLVTGFNTKPIASLTYDSATQQATASVGSGHGYLKWQVIAISGADQAGYNGEHRVTAIGSDWVRFALDAAPAATEATGEMIEIKTAPVGGWELVAEDAETFRAAFKRTDARATGLTFVVRNGDRTQYASNAANNRFASVVWVTDFVDLDTYGPETSHFWPYSDYYLNVSQSWIFLADQLMMFFAPRMGHAGKRGLVMSGDINTVRPGDSYHALLTGISANISWSSNQTYYPRALDYTNDFASYLSRGSSQLPGEVNASLVGIGYKMSDVIGYPNASDNGFYISLGSIIVREGETGTDSSFRDKQCIRGYLPGVLEPLHYALGYDLAILDNLPGLAGVPVLVFDVAVDERGTTDGMIAFRLDDWRQ